VEPRVLLLDEPFGALDAKVRKELRRWLRRLHDEIHVTSVFVTHDVEEALEVADRVVLMNNGKVEQIGTPEEVYENPATPFVFKFLGNVNLFHTRLEQTGVGYTRPHEIDVARERGGEQDVEAELVDFSGIGPIVRLELRRLDTGDVIEAEIPRSRYHELAPRQGEHFYLRARQVTVFPPDYVI
jgi:sulfate transport system ATP-binding protein